MRRCIGHTNTVEGRFYPAETGLFQYIICAQEESGQKGPQTGLYLACLDEMNLSQVEHYFSDFMMVAEREGAARVIQCFSAASVGNHCPFKNWSSVKLSPAMRFVGTVNFDETTRLLSDRFLDRVNLIQLRPGKLPALSGQGSLDPKVKGRMVTLADFQKWSGGEVLPSNIASLLDEMRPVLNDLGCPISPRVYRAICRFVGSCSPLLTPASAFDTQVAQRLLPRIRSLVTKRQLDALDRLLKLMNQNSSCSFDETIPLLDEARQTSLGRDWNQDE